MKDVGEAAADAAETGEINCTGFCSFLLASSRIESMVTPLVPVVVFRANGLEEDAGTKFCDAKPEDTDEAKDWL